MNVSSISKRVKGILMEPREEWVAIKNESVSNKEIVLGYVLPFAALAALISFFAIWLDTYLNIALVLKFAVTKLITPIISVIVAAVVINEIAETFDSEKNLNNALKLVAYSYTPYLLVDVIISISWTLGFLSFLGLYGVYLFWIGLPKMMETPDDRRLVYIIAALVVVLIVNVAISALFGIDRLGYY